jgi:hypothetical protein
MKPQCCREGTGRWLEPRRGSRSAPIDWSIWFCQRVKLSHAGLNFGIGLRLVELVEDFGIAREVLLRDLAVAVGFGQGGQRGPAGVA